MIFGCYFRIVKLPYRSALLPVALEGFSRFAHLVNIDFFRDLLEVLRKHINGTAFHQTEQDPSDPKSEEQPDHHPKKYNRHEYRDKLLCIVTAFELLSGQGEALNLDLTEIVNSFYGLLFDISTLIKLEEDEVADRKQKVEIEVKNKNQNAKSSERNLRSSTSEMVIKVLDLIFFNRSDPPTPTRAMLFTKRLLTISLTCSEPKLVLKLLKFLSKLTTRQPVIKNLFKICPATDHARRDPLEQDELDSSVDQLGWELFLLRNHWDHRIQLAVRNLIQA
jgi:nucleolar complex protein 3